MNPFQESVDPVNYWKREAQIHENQCEFNAKVARHYADKLEEIARLCGWTIPTGSCFGVPEDIENIAVRLVKTKLGL